MKEINSHCAERKGRMTERSVPIYNGNMEYLNSVTPARARLILKKDKAYVICTKPFTLRLRSVK